MIILTIEGLPVPWAAPYVTRSRHAFNPKYKEKEYYQWQIKAQWNQKILAAPLCLDFTFQMPIPQATSKVRRTQMLNGILHHIKRPDTTNLIKFAEDTLKGIVIEDDSQVCQISAQKIYGLTPKTVIKVIPL